MKHSQLATGRDLEDRSVIVGAPELRHPVEIISNYRNADGAFTIGAMNT